MKKALTGLALLVLLLVCTVSVSEFVLARKGYTLDWRRRMREHIASFADPDVREIWVKCGWGPEVGSRASDEDPNVVETVWPNGMRECRPQMEKPASFRVGVFGCSYTYGEGVPAKDTFVYRLNNRYPNVCFDNRGMRGTSLVHSLLAMRQAVARGHKYDLVVFDAIAGHFDRDPYLRVAGTLGPDREFAVAPLAHKDWQGGWTVTYSDEYNWPFEDSLLTVDFLKRAYYGYRLERERSAVELGSDSAGNNSSLPEYWLCLVEQMNKLAKDNGSDFLCCFLDYSLRDNVGDIPGIQAIMVDASDTTEPSNHVLGVARFHPNANVHAFWAQEFSKWFDKYLKSKCPEALAGVTEPNTNHKLAGDFASESAKKSTKK